MLNINEEPNEESSLSKYRKLLVGSDVGDRSGGAGATLRGIVDHCLTEEYFVDVVFDVTSHLSKRLLRRRWRPRI